MKQYFALSPQFQGFDESGFNGIGEILEAAECMLPAVRAEKNNLVNVERKKAFCIRHKALDLHDHGYLWKERIKVELFYQRLDTSAGVPSFVRGQCNPPQYAIRIMPIMELLTADSGDICILDSNSPFTMKAVSSFWPCRSILYPKVAPIISPIPQFAL